MFDGRVAPSRVPRSSVINALPGVRENVRLSNEPMVMTASGPDVNAIGRTGFDLARPPTCPKHSREKSDFVTDREIPPYA